MGYSALLPKVSSWKCLSMAHEKQVVNCACGGSTKVVSWIELKNYGRKESLEYSDRVNTGELSYIFDSKLTTELIILVARHKAVYNQLLRLLILNSR